MSGVKLVFEFNKNPSELIRLTLSEFKGKGYLSLWVFYDASETETPDWRPSKKGICLPIHLLDELKEGIEKAAAEIQGKKGEDQGAKARASREGQGEGGTDE